MQKNEENNEVRAVVEMIVPGKDQQRDQEGDGWVAPRVMKELQITPEDAQDRTFWKSRIRAADPT